MSTYNFRPLTPREYSIQSPFGALVAVETLAKPLAYEIDLPSHVELHHCKDGLHQRLVVHLQVCVMFATKASIIVCRRLAVS